MITSEDLKKLRDSLGVKNPSIFPLRVIENQLLPSDMIMVSSEIFELIKQMDNDRTAISRPEKKD